MKKRIGFLALGMWSLLPLSGFSEGVTRLWTGLGADAKASTAENWPKTGVPSNVTTGTGGQVLWRKEGLVIVVR